MILYFRFSLFLLVLLCIPILSTTTDQRFLIFEDSFTHVELNHKFGTFTAVSSNVEEYRFISSGFYIKLPNSVFVYFPTHRNNLNKNLKMEGNFRLNPYSPALSINSILIFKHSKDNIRLIDNAGGSCYKIIKTVTFGN